MGLFRKKKKEEINGSCCNRENSSEIIEKSKKLQEGVAVKVLGSGCSKCNQLEKNVKLALEKLGLDTAIEHVTDFTQIASYGVMSTPALVIEKKVVSVGKVLTPEEALKLLQKNVTK